VTEDTTLCLQKVMLPALGMTSGVMSLWADVKTPVDMPSIKHDDAKQYDPAAQSTLLPAGKRPWKVTYIAHTKK
jgi:hypothetical protein